MARITPRQRAALDAISWAEGTWDSKANRPRYNITFGHQTFDPSGRHPDRVVRSGGYASAAAGAYQFMPATWAGVAGSGARMTPEAQDRAALELIRRRGVDPDQPLDAKALNKLAPEWASLPTLANRSYYGQPVKGRDQLLQFYNQRLGAAANPGNAVPAAAADPPSLATTPSPAAGGGGGGAELLNLALMFGGGGGSGLGSIPPTAPGSSPLFAVAAMQQQGFERLYDEVGRRLTTTGRTTAPLEGGGRRRAAAPAFFSALSSLLA